MCFYRNGQFIQKEVNDFGHAVNLWKIIKSQEGIDVCEGTYMGWNGVVERIWDEVS